MPGDFAAAVLVVVLHVPIDMYDLSASTAVAGYTGIAAAVRISESNIPLQAKMLVVLCSAIWLP